MRLNREEYEAKYPEKIPKSKPIIEFPPQPPKKKRGGLLVAITYIFIVGDGILSYHLSQSEVKIEQMIGLGIMIALVFLTFIYLNREVI